MLILLHDQLGNLVTSLYEVDTLLVDREIVVEVRNRNELLHNLTCHIGDDYIATIQNDQCARTILRWVREEIHFADLCRVLDACRIYVYAELHAYASDIVDFQRASGVLVTTQHPAELADALL